MEWKEIVIIIQEIISEIKEENGIERIIKNDIFSLLEKKCTVIYYPIENEKNRGFHIKRMLKDELKDFVFINTDKTIEQQVFTAAHEYGHIINLYSKVCERANQKGKIISTNDPELEEQITDRFAAEFIMPEKEFKEDAIKYLKSSISKDGIFIIDLLKVIASLMGDYMSPFDAVRKRLFEVGLLGEGGNKYFKENKVKLGEYIEQYKKDDNSIINGKTSVKNISGLRDTIKEAYLNPNTDKMLIQKICSDFELERIELEKKIDVVIPREADGQ